MFKAPVIGDDGFFSCQLGRAVDAGLIGPARWAAGCPAALRFNRAALNRASSVSVVSFKPIQMALHG